MARNQTFNASLRLNSKDFKKGIADVQKSLAGLKNSFLAVAGALGAGLGFTQLASRLKDTAVQLSVAKNTLENVSNVSKEWTDGIDKGNVSIKNYAENLDFVKKMAKDYSQDLVALMTNFAQFHAACQQTNITLDQQKMIFESLTKAAAYYHMSADRTKDMMNAIVQMASKGRVAAEELRRQLGNSLPGAFNLMAAALGVTTSQLDDMMRKGQVLAEDALPKFAAMLNTITKDADFNSLQMSMNRLKNTWYELVENTGAENGLNRLVNGAESALSFISRNVNELKSLILGLVTAIGSYRLFDAWKKQGEEYTQTLELQMNVAKTKMKMLERTFERGLRASKGAITPDSVSVGYTGDTKYAMATIGYSTEKAVRGAIEYNNQLIKAYEAEMKLYGTSLIREDEIVAIKRYNAELQKGLGINNENKKTIGVLKAGWGGIVNLAKNLWQTLKGIGWAAIVSAIIGAAMSVLSYVKQIKDEWKRINNLVNDFKEDVNGLNASVETNAKLLRSQMRILDDESKSSPVRYNALQEINKMTGNNFSIDALDKTKKAYQDIVKEVDRWIEATKKQAKVQVYAQKAAEAEVEIERRRIDITAKETELREIGTIKGRDEYGNPVWGAKRLLDIPKVNRLKEEIKQDNAVIREMNKILGIANEELDKLQVSWLELMSEGNGGGGGGNKETDISKVFKKYNDEKKELENKLREHAISEDEYNKELDKLLVKYWEEAAGTGMLSIDKIIDKMDKGKTLTKMEKWYKELKDAAEEAAKRVLLDEMAKDMMKEIDDAIERNAKELEDMADKWADNSKADLDALLAEKPKRQPRDTTFDYKKSNSDILEERFDNASEHAKELGKKIDEIKSKYDNIADASVDVQNKLAAWEAEMKLAEKEASTLEEAMKFAKIREDIAELREDIRKTATGGLRNLAQGTDRIVQGMEDIRDTFDDVDSSGWEKFMSVFNEMIQFIDTINSVVETFNTIQELANTLSGAELALQQQKITMLEKELQLRMALAAARQVENKMIEEGAAASALDAVASESAAAAKAKEGLAGAVSSGAKLPFPYNLVAIAAGVAAVVGALMSLSKFANGGIVGGNSYSGDKRIARVNSGEMILNRAQQSSLWNTINGRGGAVGQVEFKIRGADLVGSIKNYNRLTGNK